MKFLIKIHMKEQNLYLDNYRKHVYDITCDVSQRILNIPIVSSKWRRPRQYLEFSDYKIQDTDTHSFGIIRTGLHFWDFIDL